MILLASALHYADDQPALIQALVERLSDSGTLILELGIASSRKAEWIDVKRGIDERAFPSMPMLRQVLSDYAWKWMGPSVLQDGDPVARHVVHISRRRPVAYLLMQPPGYGKSSIASGLFPRADIPIVSGDEQIGLVAKGKAKVSEALRAAIMEGYSPYHLDQTIQRIFEQGLGGELVALWLGQAKDNDVALDVYVPSAYHGAVEQLLEDRGYLPVQLRWERVGQAPLPEAMMAEQAEAFYLSMLDVASDSRASEARRSQWDPAGFVDEVMVDGDQLVIRGWAIDESGALPGKILVKIGRRTITVEKIDRQLRPDVQRHLGLPHALVGYRASVAAPEVRTSADLTNGFKVFVRGGATFQLAGEVNTIFSSRTQ
ncbi:hypothetical protein TI01_0890 [Lysobacter sp. A03]|nr:hypothetical protein TI01_0890 [Lysobacter sp. A03]